LNFRSPQCLKTAPNLSCLAPPFPISERTGTDHIGVKHCWRNAGSNRQPCQGVCFCSSTLQ